MLSAGGSPLKRINKVFFYEKLQMLLIACYKLLLHLSFYNASYFQKGQK